MFDNRYVTVLATKDPLVCEEIEDLLEAAGLEFREASPGVGCVVYPGPAGFGTPREIGEMYRADRDGEVQIQVRRRDLDKARSLVPDWQHLTA